MLVDKDLNNAAPQVQLFVLLQRSRYRNRLYLAILVAALIAGLLHQTQWFDLRPGLMVLLAGQILDVLSLAFKIVQLSKDAHLKLSDAWFQREESFIRRLAVFDVSCQTIGFMAVGYAFWISTRNEWLSLGIGIVYPFTMYFGMNRRRTLIAIKQLKSVHSELYPPASKASG